MERRMEMWFLMGLKGLNAEAVSGYQGLRLRLEGFGLGLWASNLGFRV